MREELETFKNALTMKWTEKDKGFLVSSDFVKDFEKSTEQGLPPSEIDNKKLKRRNAFVPDLREKLDYFVIPEPIYDELVDLFGGGPKISCGFDEFGNPLLYPVEIVFCFESKERKFKLSKFGLVSDCIELLAKEFSLDVSRIRIFPEGAKAWITCTQDMTIAKLLELGSKFKMVEKQEIVKQEKPVVTEKPRAGKRMSGLKNLGNSCYMNASIQALFSLSRFTQRLKEEGKAGRFTKAFLDVIEDMSKGKVTCDLSSFKQIVGSLLKTFANNRQQDAQEFACALIDVLHNENPEILDEEFYGRDVSITTCAKCSDKSTVEESFNVLSLPISGGRSVIFSPWKLTEPMTQRTSIQEEERIELVGQCNADERIQIVTKETMCDFSEIIAFQLPVNFEQEENEGLAVLHITSGKMEICKPILVRANLGEQEGYRVFTRVWNRIEELWDTGEGRNRIRKSMKLTQYPKKFTLIQKSFLCNEQIVVDVGDYTLGFHRIRSDLISPPVSLADLIHGFLEVSRLSSDNAWKCEKCGEQTRASHQVQLEVVPKTLIIQLKRFSKTRRLERDNTIITIPESITVSGKHYDLVAVVNHRGSLTAGHYTATCKRGDKWYLCNDSNVTIESEPLKPTPNPYLLFYTE